MDKVDELKLKLMVKQAVHEELDEFYRKLAMLLEHLAGYKKLTPTLQKVLDLIEEKEEATAEDISNARKISRAGAVQACSRLYEMGFLQKIKRGKKVYYTLA